MIIDSLSGKRYELALELFSDGADSINYKSILFVKSMNELQVYSYLNGTLENASIEIAKKEIDRSKSVMADLEEKSPEFKKAIEGLKIEFLFCYDYHTAAVALAIEKNGELSWLMKSESS